MATTLRTLWKNDVFKTIITLALIPIIIIGFWAALPKALNTDVFPLFVVISPSMCIPNEDCSVFSHTFERTLHVGDLIIIQGADAKDLKTDYPNSDIIVFRNPTVAINDSKANIVHRIVDVVEVDGKLYFYTKGDGNRYPHVWPQEPPTREYLDDWRSNPVEDPNSTYDGAISQDYVYGKVVMRIPWVGSIAMQSQKNSAIPMILGVIIVLIIIFEFILPLIRKRSTQTIETIKDTNEEQTLQNTTNDLLTDQTITLL
ncbi:MAG: signal peptidase I [Candidatus Bathyarchaeota archaeon]|nr:signal peptidase I [Candidatus Termiticorpusculum sp.]